MAENIWWLIEFADRLDMDITNAMQTFLTQKEEL